MLGQLVDPLGVSYRHYPGALLQLPPGDAPTNALSGTGAHGDSALETLVYSLVNPAARMKSGGTPRAVLALRSSSLSDLKYLGVATRFSGVSQKVNAGKIT
jgi:hypothetical protein